MACVILLLRDTFFLLAAVLSSFCDDFDFIYFLFLENQNGFLKKKKKNSNPPKQ